MRHHASHPPALRSRRNEPPVSSRSSRRGRGHLWSHNDLVDGAIDQQPRLDPARENEAARTAVAIEWLHSQAVARAEEPGSTGVPDSEGEHAIHALETRRSPLCISLQHAFSVTARTEPSLEVHEVGPELDVVEDLTLEDEPEG